MNILPVVGLSKAPMIFSKVVLPLPEGPTIDTNSALLTVNVIFLSGITLLTEESYTFEIFLTSKAKDVLGIFVPNSLFLLLSAVESILIAEFALLLLVSAVVALLTSLT